MDIEFAERIAIAMSLIASGVVAYHLALRLALRRAGGRLKGLEAARRGLPAILYFTSPGCVPCRTVQGPAIDCLAAAYGPALQVIKIDAQARPDLADHWGVLSVPTTFVIDRDGQPRFLNAGVASAVRLERQLIEAGLAPAASSSRSRAASAVRDAGCRGTAP